VPSKPFRLAPGTGDWVLIPVTKVIGRRFAVP
jgi:hypothetical protein